MTKSNFLFTFFLLCAATLVDASQGHDHHAAVFMGATTEDSHTHFTVGVDYEYRFVSEFGVGAFYEHIFGTPDINIVGAPFFWHPIPEGKILVAPGGEFKEGHSAFLVRTGLGYDIALDPVTFTPSFFVDFIEGGHEAFVYGIAVGYGF